MEFYDNKQSKNGGAYCIGDNNTKENEPKICWCCCWCSFFCTVDTKIDILCQSAVPLNF